MGFSFRLAARVLLYTLSHRQDCTYHCLCYTSHGALAGTRNSSMGPPWRNDPTTHRTMSEHSYDGALMLKCVFCVQVDAIEFYTEEEQAMLSKCEQEKVKAYQDPLGIMFITFQQDFMAERWDDLLGGCHCWHAPIRALFKHACHGHNLWLPLPESFCSRQKPVDKTVPFFLFPLTLMFLCLFLFVFISQIILFYGSSNLNYLVLSLLG